MLNALLWNTLYSLLLMVMLLRGHPEPVVVSFWRDATPSGRVHVAVALAAVACAGVEAGAHVVRTARYGWRWWRFLWRFEHRTGFRGTLPVPVERVVIVVSLLILGSLVLPTGMTVKNAKMDHLHVLHVTRLAPALLVLTAVTRFRCRLLFGHWYRLPPLVGVE